jgi:hypothetical protein
MGLVIFPVITRYSKGTLDSDMTALGAINISSDRDRPTLRVE